MMFWYLVGGLVSLGICMADDNFTDLKTWDMVIASILFFVFWPVVLGGTIGLMIEDIKKIRKGLPRGEK